jgi:hypothetical protein
MALALLGPVPPGQVAAMAASAVPLERIAGDYSVAVYPRPFGFLVRGDSLWLRVGGVADTSRAVPLVRRADGRFALTDAHPNAFEFALEGDSVAFRFWAGSQVFPGQRIGAAPVATPGVPTAARPTAPAAPIRTRLDHSRSLDSLAAAAAAAGASATTRYQHARALFEAGEFARARRQLDAPGVGGVAEAVELRARLDLLAGRHAEAESGYARVAAARAADPAARAQALVGTLFAHYQSDRFRDIARLDFPAGVRLPLLTQARSFARNPYRQDWATGRRETHIRFQAADPLPVFPVQVGARVISVILDTGADQLILDTELARTLGVVVVDSAMGSFAGGRSARVGFGSIPTLRLGTVTLHDVPVQVLPVARFTFDRRRPVGGILGTSILRQFRATVDYARRRLTLRARDQAWTPAAAAVEVPFVMDATHLLYARGGLGSRDDLTLFVDSGLASEAAVVLPTPTLTVLGLASPVMQPTAPDVGGGTGSFDRGVLPLDRVALGSLEQRALQAEVGALTPATYWARGFIQDGLVSHRFLRQYSRWTLDFGRRVFVFER